ncbi:MAG TPA: hypothetical protein VGK21_14460, partial [Candidatus Angelobacter sp.]
MKRVPLILFFLVLPATLFLWGQQKTPLHPTLPTITFARVWEAYKPQDINITVQSTGSAKYLSRNPFTPP